MAQYRKKPVVIEAEQWFPGREVAGVVPLPEHVRARMTSVERDGEGREAVAFVDTLEGGHIVSAGDWIITGVKGERYPCKPDIFEATYEPA